MESNKTVYCSIHGPFYSGYPECPTCAAMEPAAQPEAREKPDDWGLGISLKAAPKGDYQLPTPEQRREKRLAEIERIISLRCLRSGNPWGTDTEQLGTCCSCGNCRLVVSQLNEIPELCRELRLSDARVRELEAVLSQLREDYRTPEPCGHMKNFLIGDDHGNFTCTVCRAEIADDVIGIMSRLQGLDA